MGGRRGREPRGRNVLKVVGRGRVRATVSARTIARAGVDEDKISFQRDTYTFDFPGPPTELLAEFRRYYGPTMNAFEAAAASGREDELQGELHALVDEHNANGSEAPTSIPATYLRVTVALNPRDHR